MKKMLKILAVLALVLIVCVSVLLRYLGGRPAAPDNYQQTVETGGAIEAAYMNSGPYDVSVYEEAVLQGFQKYTIYYPSQLGTANRPYPVIVICNGSGTPISKYPAVPRHFASWGFIVIGTEEEFDWNGFSASMCIRHLHTLNSTKMVDEKENVFYQKVDLDHAGIIGHSQGGVGVFNAITEENNGFKAAVSLSPTNKELAHNLEWDYNAALAAIPTLLVAGAGGGDDWVLTGEQLNELYGDLSCDKVMCRRADTAHGETLYSANGYATAWFMYWLQGDETAGAAFVGDSPELMSNTLYQDQQIHLRQ